jgi:hypothetical protein
MTSPATIQTTFDQYFNAAKLGEIYDRRTSVAESFVAQAAIRFGQAVVAGTDLDRQVTIPAGTGMTFRGISIGVWQIEQQLTAYPTTSSGSYSIAAVVPVLRRGSIWVRVSQDVNPDDPVYFVHTDADPTIVGTFRKDANTNKADLVPHASFRKAALNGGLAVVEINLP